MAGTVNADVVITGSSRAAMHYDPEVIRQRTGLTAFNLGRTGSQTDVQAAVLRAYLRHNKKPAFVIHNLDFFSFEATDAKGHQLYDPGTYIPYLREPDVYATLHQANPEVWKWKHIPLYGYAVEDMRLSWFFGLCSLLGSHANELESSGFDPRDVKWGEDFASFRAMFPKGVEAEVTPRGEQAMDELVSVCRQAGIQLILVYSPEYYEMQKLTHNRRDIFGKFEHLATQPGVLFWDFSNSGICTNQDFFYNSQHLNRQGAEAFTADLADKLAVFAKLQPGRAHAG